jgi:hypothetical protein
MIRIALKLSLILQVVASDINSAFATTTLHR